VILEFEPVNYRGHPGVVTEMNLFLLIEQIDPTIIKSNKNKKHLEAENKTALGEVKGLDKKGKNGGQDLTNLTTAVAGLRSKVNKP
jgi:hypothetical protein